jgi:hypothetical protein
MVTIYSTSNALESEAGVSAGITFVSNLISTLKYFWTRLYVVHNQRGQTYRLIILLISKRSIGVFFIYFVVYTYSTLLQELHGFSVTFCLLGQATAWTGLRPNSSGISRVGKFFLDSSIYFVINLLRISQTQITREMWTHKHSLRTPQVLSLSQYLAAGARLFFRIWSRCVIDT